MVTAGAATIGLATTVARVTAPGVSAPVDPAAFAALLGAVVPAAGASDEAPKKLLTLLPSATDEVAAAAVAAGSRQPLAEDGTELPVVPVHVADEGDAALEDESDPSAKADDRADDDALLPWMFFAPAVTPVEAEPAFDPVLKPTGLAVADPIAGAVRGSSAPGAASEPVPARMGVAVDSTPAEPFPTLPTSDGDVAARAPAPTGSVQEPMRAPVDDAAPRTPAPISAPTAEPGPASAPAPAPALEAAPASAPALAAFTAPASAPTPASTAAPAPVAEAGPAPASAPAPAASPASAAASAPASAPAALPPTIFVVSTEPTPVSPQANAVSPAAVAPVALSPSRAFSSARSTEALAPTASVLTGAFVAAASFAGEDKPLRQQAEDALSPAADLAVAPPAALRSVSAPVAPDGAALDTGRADWMSAMIDRIQEIADVGSGGRVTHLKLLPDALGPVEVRVRHHEGAISVDVSAQQPATQQLLADATPRLAALAEERGLRLAYGDAGSGAGARAGSGGGDAPRGQAPTAAHVSDGAADDTTDHAGAGASGPNTDRFA